jgi:heat shock protein HtpX
VEPAKPSSTLNLIFSSQLIKLKESTFRGNAMFKRIFLFIFINLLVVITISLVLNVLGVNRYITHYGINYQTLIIFCLIWGMGGAFISLAISRIIAKWTMGIKLVDNTTGGQYSELYNIVRNLTNKAGLSSMPEVGVYESPEINAFATGPSRKRSLVAVSSGLLSSMDKNQIEGVLGHEIAHIVNGDMVTMTLLQGIINAFVMFLARVIAFAVNMAVSNNSRDGRGLGRIVNWSVIMLLEIVFSLLGSIVVAAYSRY